MVAKNAMEIFTLLNKSNCRECGEKTCLAFAGKVFLGQCDIGACPYVGRQEIQRLNDNSTVISDTDENSEEYISSLKHDISMLDFAETAEKIGAGFDGSTMEIRMLGKSFGIQREDGAFVTDLHLIPWVVMPLLEYVLRCQGAAVTGDWVSFRELEDGKGKYPLFKKRGEEVLKQLADKYTDFFDDIVHMFDGKQVEKEFESDVSVVLYLLPLVPVMICYWKPEEGMGSSLNLFFDRSADQNLGADSVFFLGTGLAQMFEKLAEHHGF